MSEETRAHRPWALWLLTPLMLAGSAIGVYMARHHEVELYGGEAYAGEELVGCEEAAGVSCDLVNTSAWSEILGVPTFAWAVPTYLLVLVLAVLAARGAHRVKPLILAVGLGCVGLSGWLGYVSVVELEHVCLWCMRLYAINAAIPVLAGLSGIRRDDLPGTRELGLAAAVFATLAAVTVGVQQTYRAQLLADAPAVAALPDLDEVEAQAQAHDGLDPEGDAPELRIPVTTEDGQQAELLVRADDAWKGAHDADVVIVEFADFECGYCKRAASQLHRLLSAYEDEVLFVYKHFPMHPECNPGVKNPKHRDACNAHAAAVCAQEQDRFWVFHDLLYKNNHQLRDEHLITYAEQVGLDMDAFMSCMRDGRAHARVRLSGQDGANIDTHGTPRIWIDGRLYRAGSSAEQMARAIELALGRTAAEAAKAAAKVREERPTIAPIPDDVPPMQRVQHGDVDVWIDTFEASLVDGTAHVGKHEIPATSMSWFAAEAACEAAGKRMCTEREWLAACQTAAPVDDDGDGELADDLIEGNSYPYGDFHTPNMCWENRRGTTRGADGEEIVWRPVYTGEMPGCVTSDGVYDLTGNVEEWVGASAEEAVLLGGAFDTPDDKARCYRRNDTYGAGYSNVRTGFRCCRDPE